ncbi:hypothetical protein CEXT_442211 [Caerostris extrusa]|uniref:Uncharacterized protein n=1 Tax=Caerostris extrusa TaxID=172846 RepID=A0AAV4N3X9_CAEEX|nr:hypothetical protein CEXT_442211 [Caerostris extrusa]
MFKVHHQCLRRYGSSSLSIPYKVEEIQEHDFDEGVSKDHLRNAIEQEALVFKKYMTEVITNWRKLKNNDVTSKMKASMQCILHKRQMS